MRILPTNIMCAIDFSGSAPQVLTYGKSLAREFDANLFTCHIIPDAVMLSSHAHPGYTSEEVTTQRLEDATQSIVHLAEKMDIQSTPLVSLGHAGDEIPRLAQAHGIDLVIAATHGGSGIKRFLVGSVTDRLVKTLECPLLVLHSQSKQEVDRFKPPLRRVLAGCDFSPGSKLAFNYALSLAQEFEAELHLVHVIKPQRQIELGTADYIKLQEGDYPGWNLNTGQTAAGEEYDRRQHLLSRIERQLANMVPLESRHWCTPVTSVRQGEPYQEVIAYANEHQIDMVILGIHGHSLLEQFLVGSTTDRVISRAECPVMAVRQTSEM